MDEGHRSEHAHAHAEKKEDDFFHEHSHTPLRTVRDDVMTLSSNSSDPALDRSQSSSPFISLCLCTSIFCSADQQTEGPSVDPNVFNSDGSGKALDPKKTTIGQRRAPPAKKVPLHALSRTFDLYRRSVYLERLWRPESEHWLQRDRTECTRTRENAWTTIPSGNSQSGRNRKANGKTNVCTDDIPSMISTNHLLGLVWSLPIKIWINNATLKKPNWNNRTRRRPNRWNVSAWVSAIEGKHPFFRKLLDLINCSSSSQWCQP